MNSRTRIALIIDDSPEDRELYQRYLLRDREHSYTILEAATGQHGLELWQQQPDVVLLDYRLPDLNGLEFLAHLQTSTQQVSLPVIIITGQGNEAIAAQAVSAGAQDYLVKEQVNPEGLRLSINRTIATVYLHTQLQQQLERERLTRHISQQIHQSLELDEILHTTVTEVRRFLQTDRVIVFRLEPGSSGTVIAESVGSAYRAVLSTNIHDPCFDTGYIDPYQQGRVMAKSDIYDGSLTACHVEFLAQFQVQANLVVPILRDGQLWGLLIAHHCSTPRAWQPMEIELLQQLAIHLGIALQQANAYAQLEQQSEARYRAIVEDQTELIVRYLPDTTIQFVNGAFCRYFEVQPEEIIGKSYEPVIFEADREWVAQLVNSITPATPTVTIEYRVVVNGEIRWTQWVNRKLFNEQGQCTELQSVGRDITTLKEAEAQLRHSSERISLANAELARAARLKDEFLANMSHELRTPLNSILGLSEILLEEVFGLLTDRQRQFLQTIEQSGQLLLSLINDILDLSKIESGKMELDLQSVAVKSICQSSLNFVKQQAQQKRIDLNYNIEHNLIEIEADERRLLQALVNLLTNAVKFTPEGGRVELSVQVNARQQCVELRVSDTGIGIAPDNLQQIFQPFIQLDSSLSRRYTGTGLGLSIVQRIVELHRGSIRVESEVGHGSCFTVMLPWRPDSSPGSAYAPNTLSQSANAQSALATEDLRAVANSIQQYLAELGSASVIHSLGDSALSAALRIKPDLIVLDTSLPDRSGWDILGELKAHAQLQSVPVIVISAVDERSHNLELDAVAHLPKPLSQPAFYQALDRLFADVQPSKPNLTLIIAPAELPPPLILLAEDNEANIALMLNYLEALSFRVTVARNGIEAIAMTKMHQPDLILMDIQMPDMDGLEAIRQLRADAQTRSIPIIALTALAMPGDAERCLDAGASEYLAKPIKLRLLLERINHQLSVPKD